MKQMFNITNAAALSGKTLSATECACVVQTNLTRKETKMTTKPSIFPLVYCNADYVKNLAEEAVANGYKPIVPEKCGFVLAGKCLVPFSFVNLVSHELSGLNFRYGDVLTEAIFGTEFLQSLDEDEHAVLMHVVLFLIERGDLELDLFEAEDEGVA